MSNRPTTPLSPAAEAGAAQPEQGQRRKRWLAVPLALVLAAMPLSIVLASHLFPDVPNANAHHNTITRIAKAGITAGCFGSANYCPDDPVSRAQMATFLNRSLGRVGIDFDGAIRTIPEDSLAIEVAALSITVPGANNAYAPNQFVKLDGMLTVFGNGTTAGCPCDYTLVVSGPNGTVGQQYGQLPADASAQETAVVSGVAIAAPGPTEYTLTFSISNGTGDLSYINATLIATTYAFGPEGTHLLTPGGAVVVEGPTSNPDVNGR